MRVAVVAGGSRGDVQPLIPVARANKAAGHEVTVAASRDAKGLIAGHGLGFHGLDVSVTGQLSGDAGQAWIVDSAGRPMRELRHMRRVYEEMAEPLADGLLGLSGRADLFVSGILSIDAVVSLAAYDGVAHACALLAPFHPSADGRAGLTATNSRTRRSNLTRTRIGRWLLARSSTQAGRIVRKRLALPETGAKGFIGALDQTPAILGASPLLVPTPEDWPSTVAVTGHWPLPSPDEWSPPQPLVDFLAAGRPPVYLGFGSMSVAQPERTREVAVAAVRASGHRLLLAGTDATGPVDDHVFGIEDVPHDWLFPRTRAVVHHGGAGTTHAALAAGVPQLAVPHVADQPYWGRRIHEEGLGPAPIQLRRLNAETLTARLRELTTTAAHAKRAAALGDLARAEHGVATASEALLTTDVGS